MSKRTTSEIHSKNKQFAKRFKKAAPAKVPRGAINRTGAGKPELKNIDVVTANSRVAVNNTGALLTLLNPTAQGVGAQQRLGRKFRMRSIFVRWSGGLAPTTTGNGGLRLLIVYDKEPNGVALTAVQVLTVDDISGLMNLDNQDRFSVLVDELIPCVGTQGPQAWTMKRYQKLNHEVITTDTNNGTVADIITGSVYALFYSGAGTFQVAAPTGSFESRIRFQDE